MKHAFRTVMAAKVALLLTFAPGALPAPCPAGTTSMAVSTAVELQTMINMINCTGEGTFDVTWSGSVPLLQTIEVCETKQLTVTGSTSTGSASTGSASTGSSSMGSTSATSNLPSDVIDAGSTTGIFRVCNGSTLNLKNLVLEGGFSTTGAAVDARASSSVYVEDCAFTSNNATTGGAIYALSSEVYISGDTIFADNSAKAEGGAIYAENSEMRVDGTVSFSRNSAVDGGGAVYGSSSNVQVLGESYFGHNSVEDSGGALYVYNCSTFISGTTTFDHSSAGEDGGAVSASDSKLYMEGTSSFGGNSAVEVGGAVFAKGSDVRIEGITSFADNSAGDTGGAISIEGSNMTVDGWTSMTNNSAVASGGGIYTKKKSIVHLDGEAYFSLNSAGEHGGGICGRKSTIYVDGEYTFSNNSAVERGGAVMSLSSELHMSGTNLFDRNSAGDSGGGLACVGSDVYTTGENSFTHNSAKKRGGGLFSGNSDVRITGQTWFGYNSALSSGGAVQGHTAPISMDGNTTFTYNTAGENGGAINYYTGEEVGIVGIATFSHNSAKWRGGAVSMVSAEIRIVGTASFSHNTGYDGGAVDTQQSLLVIDGDARFWNNSADHDGGALNIHGANATIVGDMELSSNTALNGGGIFAAQCDHVQVLGPNYFAKNTAKFYGGAISLSDPVKFNINGASFESNNGASGGAVSVTSTERTTGGFADCRFDSNAASNGGALHLSTGYTGESENRRFVRDSVFVNNVAAESGGGLYNAGALDVSDAVFSDNVAGEGGLAIHDEGSFIVMENVTFDDNKFSCAEEQYTDVQEDIDDGSCRFELVCEQCVGGCDVDESIARVTSDSLPVCEDIPEGVSTSTESTTTLQTFDLLKGYYRVSSESRVIRECYLEDACTGGTDHHDYCAEGYTGPYCAVCADGYASGVLSSCHECSTNNRRWTLGIGIIVLVVLMVVMFMVVSHTFYGSSDAASAGCPKFFLCCQNLLVKGLPLSAIKIVVVVWQIITQFAEVAGAVYPDEYEDFLAKLSVINVNIGSILSNSCIFSTDFYDNLLLATITPAVVLLILFGTLWRATRRNTTDENGATQPILHNKRASTGLFVLFFVYSTVSFKIFQTFVCDDLDNGVSYLRADYSIECYTAKHDAYLTYASVMVCVYPVGIPAFFGWWLARNRHDLGKPGREDMDHLKSSQSLWGAYSPACYYYEVVECCRRIVLTGAAVFILPDTVEQIAIIFLLSVVFTFIFESLAPFDTKADMWLYRWGNAIILFSMYVALILKADLTDSSSETSSTMTALFITANVVLIVVVAVETALLVKGLYASEPVVEQVTPVSSFFRDASLQEVMAS